MTAPQRERRTVSFDEVRPGPVSGDYSAGHLGHESAPVNEALSSAGSLQRALRAARTPLIEGIDFNNPDSLSDPRAQHDRNSQQEALEKSRVDTLSPLDSVPPPAPFPAEPPPPRPSIVPPVRRPSFDLDQNRVRRSEPPPRIRSDPPPRIPISDRPSAAPYRSDRPVPLTQSEPPLSSRRAPTFGHESPLPAEAGIEAIGIEQSEEARRREAVTIPADSRAPSMAPPYDLTMPLPSLRTPSFAAGQLPVAIRQHENSRLRNVAITMMFVICIVTGAIAGMRWYVAREQEPEAAQDKASVSSPRPPRLKLDRLEPNALVAPRLNTRESALVHPAASANPVTSTQSTVPKSSRPSTEPTAGAREDADAAAMRSPWQAPSSEESGPRLRDAKRSSKPAQTKASPTAPKNVDTKTPLIMD